MSIAALLIISTLSSAGDRKSDIPESKKKGYFKAIVGGAVGVACVVAAYAKWGMTWSKQQVEGLTGPFSVAGLALGGQQGGSGAPEYRDWGRPSGKQERRAPVSSVQEVKEMVPPRQIIPEVHNAVPEVQENKSESITIVRVSAPEAKESKEGRGEGECNRVVLQPVCPRTKAELCGDLAHALQRGNVNTLREFLNLLSQDDVDIINSTQPCVASSKNKVRMWRAIADCLERKEIDGAALLRNLKRYGINLVVTPQVKRNFNRALDRGFQDSAVQKYIRFFDPSLKEGLMSEDQVKTLLSTRDVADRPSSSSSNSALEAKQEYSTSLASSPVSESEILLGRLEARYEHKRRNDSKGVHISSGDDFFSELFALDLERGERNIHDLDRYPYLQAHVWSIFESLIKSSLFNVRLSDVRAHERSFLRMLNAQYAGVMKQDSGCDFWVEQFASQVQKRKISLQALRDYPYLCARIKDRVNKLAEEAKDVLVPGGPAAHTSDEISDTLDILSHDDLPREFVDALRVINYKKAKRCLELDPYLLHREYKEDSTVVAHNDYIARVCALPVMEDRRKFLQLLIDNKANVNYIDRGNNRPLHRAIQGQAPADIIKLLIEHRANVRDDSKQRMTPIELLNSLDHTDIDWVHWRKTIRPVLTHAMCAPYYDDFKRIDAVNSIESDLPRVLAQIIYDYADMGSDSLDLIKKAIKDDTLDDQGRTVKRYLEYFSSCPYPFKHEVLECGLSHLFDDSNERRKLLARANFSMARQHMVADMLMKQKNLCINGPDAEGNTILHRTPKGVGPNYVSLLVQHKADPFARNKKGYMPCDPKDAETRDRLGPALCKAFDDARVSLQQSQQDKKESDV